MFSYTFEFYFIFSAIYLASRAGDYVVGSTLIVDGGVTYAR